MKKNSKEIKKSLGQHYLTNRFLLEKICRFVLEQYDDHTHEKTTAIEIGSGTGWLTKLLLRRADKVVAIEIENDSVELLSQYCSEGNHPHPRLEIINKDALTLDFGKLLLMQSVEKPIVNQRLVVCGNLPYNISSRLILKMLEEVSVSKVKPQKMVFLIQKEVAERFCVFKNTPFSFRKLMNRILSHAGVDENKRIVLGSDISDVDATACCSSSSQIER